MKIVLFTIASVFVLAACQTTYYYRDGKAMPIEGAMQKRVNYNVGAFGASGPVVVSELCGGKNFSKVRIERGFWDYKVDVNCER